MAVYLPSPTELVPLPPPKAACIAFDMLGMTFGALTWNAFLVTTTAERKILYRVAQLHVTDVNTLEWTLTDDTRKLTVRRCVWDASIAECVCADPPPSASRSSSGQQHQQHQNIIARHSDPYAPVDASLLGSEVGPTISSADCDALGTPRSISDCGADNGEDDGSDDDLTVLRNKQPRPKRLEGDTRHSKNNSSTTEYQPLTNDSPTATAVAPPDRNLSRGALQTPSVASSFPPPLDSFHPLFVGIENQANTCYLSSALQSLFHIPYFRRCIYDIDLQTLRRKDVAQCLQSLFGALQLKYPAVTTVPLTTAFKWTSDDLRHQHDVHEMILILLDCIEKQMFQHQSRTNSPNNNHVEDSGLEAASASDTNPGGGNSPHAPPPPVVNFVQKLFHGEQSYVTKAVDADYESRQSEPFLVVELPVEKMPSLEASLEEISRPATIDGFMIDNPDGTKTSHTVERALKFTQLPPVLMIHPNRVVFDFERMAQVTVNTKWTFPIHLSLDAFTQQRTPCASQERATDDEDTAVAPEGTPESGAREGNDSPPCGEPAVPQQTDAGHDQMQREGSLFQQASSTYPFTEYELRSVVLHSGTAASGHYIACIRLGENRWVCLNDTSTYTVYESDVLRRAFGGDRMYLSDREERAKLLVYVRKSSAARLLAEVPVPEPVKILAREHEQRIHMEYYVLNEAFAHALGARKLDIGGSTSVPAMRIEFPASSTFDDVTAKIAQKHGVAPADVLVWKYGYRYVEHSHDKATRITTVAGLLHQSNLVVELLHTPRDHATLSDPAIVASSLFCVPEGEQAAHVDPTTIATMYPLRVWMDGALQYCGTVRSAPAAVATATRLCGAAIRSVVKRDASGTSTATAASSERRDNDAQSSSSGASSDTDKADGDVATADDTWNLYAFYGSSISTLHSVGEHTEPIVGVNLIAAPSSVPPSDIKDVLNAQPIEITFFMMHQDNADESTELWNLVVDENMTYTELQAKVFARLQDTALSEGEDFAAAYLPEGPSLIGFHSHHIDTCGASRTLQHPYRKGHFGGDVRVRDLVRTNSSHSVIRRLYIEILPTEMCDPKIWAEMQAFLVATGFDRKVFAYANLYTNNSVGDFVKKIHAQAQRVLPELVDMPPQRLRILGINWSSKIYRDFSDFEERLVGNGVTSYTVDVKAVAPQCAEAGDGADGARVADGTAETIHRRHRSDAHDAENNGGEEDGDKTKEEEGPPLPAPVDPTPPSTPTDSDALPSGWERYDVYHITQYGGSEDIIAPPTNIVLCTSDPTQITGQVVMDAVLEGSRLDPTGRKFASIRGLSRIVLRGRFMVDTVVLDRDASVTPDVLRELGGGVNCILVDHTEWMFSADKTPSPGRSPAKPLQRAPEAGIRIASD